MSVDDLGWLLENVMTDNALPIPLLFENLDLDSWLMNDLYSTYAALCYNVVSDIDHLFMFYLCTGALEIHMPIFLGRTLSKSEVRSKILTLI
jgi:hypothetical protein